MVSKSPWVFCGCLMALVLIAAVGILSTPPADIASARVGDQYGELPLYFIENQGQVDQRIAYYLQGEDTSVCFTSDGVLFTLSEPRKRKEESPFQPASYQQPAPRDRWSVKLEFVGANQEAQPVGVERTEAIVSYFKGRPEDWKTGLATYAGVVYKELWPGIDLEYLRGERPDSGSGSSAPADGLMPFARSCRRARPDLLEANRQAALLHR